jgi:hypothetical protein
MNTIDPVVLNKIRYHIDSLKNILGKNRVRIAVSTSSGTANLIPEGFSITNDSMIQEGQEIVMADDLPQVDLPIVLYDPEFESIVKD